MSKTVLIVEDNELNMKLFHDLLEAHGIQTLEVRDGNNVLEIARTKKPDLILMDIQLPEVSGLDVTKWLKADDELKHIPVIAVTAFAMKGDEEKIRQGGCEDYISKPISVMRFLEVIQKHLNEKSTDEPTEQVGVAEETTEEDDVSFEIRPRGSDEEDEEIDEFLTDDEEEGDIILPVKNQDTDQ
jgi:two-component system cell cycle response regulator DivK